MGSTDALKKGLCRRAELNGIACVRFPPIADASAHSNGDAMLSEQEVTTGGASAKGPRSRSGFSMMRIRALLGNPPSLFVNFLHNSTA
jgi:hypothetical protein